MSTPADRSNQGQIVYLAPREAAAGFTPRDRLELERWAGQGRRSIIYQDEHVPFAMLYKGPEPWASWAVMRQGAELVLWNCVTFADVGRFRTMHDALAALPGTLGAPWVPLANVVALPPPVRSRWAS